MLMAMEIALCTHLQWCLSTSIAEIPSWDYVYLQCEAPMSLDVRAGRTIIWVNEVLPSGVLLLEGMDGKKCREHSKNCTPCHLPIKGIIHPELVVVPECLPYFVCGEKKKTVTMLFCDQCQRGWHMACLRQPFTSLPFGHWNYPHCRGSSIFGASTSCIQRLCVVNTVLCLPKWKMRSSTLDIRSDGWIDYLESDVKTS